MALDHRRWIAADRHRLDDVRVERSLGQEFGFADAFGGFLKNFNESFADYFALLFRVGDAFEPAQEKFGGILITQFNFEMTAENLPHHARLAPAEHTVVYENASELAANRFVEQRRRHAGVDSAAQAQDDALAPNLL